LITNGDPTRFAHHELADFARAHDELDRASTRPA
jgi:hypothetical protein